MRIIVLGAAAGGGFPQWNCNCTNCRRARSGDPAAIPRTQSSLAITADGERWLLLNASPDIGRQIAATPDLHPQSGYRHSPIAAVLLTNADVDHVAGLLTIRERWPFALYATEKVQATLAHDSIFGVLERSGVAKRQLAIGETLEITDAADASLGLEIEVISVPGKVALYLEDESAGTNFGTTAEDTIGLVIREPGRRESLFYVPGCASVPPDLLARLNTSSLVLFDGTVWHDDEMIRMGVGEKTGRRMGHMPIAGPDGSLAALGSLTAERKVYIHINNTNPILLADSPEKAALDEAGWQVAYDGMEFVL